MRKRELAQKVELLKDGQIVRIDGLYFSAKKVNEYFPPNPCDYCDVDCLCKGDVAEICDELNLHSKSVWYLHLKS